MSRMFRAALRAPQRTDRNIRLAVMIAPNRNGGKKLKTPPRGGVRRRRESDDHAFVK